MLARARAVGRWVVGSGILSLGLSTLAAAQAPAQDGGGGQPPASPAAPHARVGTSVRELGDVHRGSVIQYRFEVHNEGNAPLELGKVSIPCACAVIAPDPVIAAGSTGGISVTAETSPFAGPVEIVFSAATNDPSSPLLQFTLKATVLPLVKVHPGFGRFQYVLGEPVGVISQRVWADDFADLVISDVVSPVPFLDAKLRELGATEKPAGAAGRQWQIDLALRPDAAIGSIAGFVTFKTNHPVDRLGRIVVSGFVRPSLTLTPSIAKILPPVVAAEGTRVSVDLRNFATAEVDVKVGSVTPSLLEVSVEPVVPGRRFWVVIKLPAGLPQGEFRGSVRLKTTDPIAPELILPIEALIQ